MMTLLKANINYGKQQYSIYQINYPKLNLSQISILSNIYSSSFILFSSYSWCSCYHHFDKNKTPDSLSDNQVLPTQVVERFKRLIRPIFRKTFLQIILDWKTHQSSQLGFKVKYPSNWYFSGDVLTSYEMEIQTKEFMLKN